MSEAVEKGLHEGGGSKRVTTAEVNRARDIANSMRRLPELPEALERLLPFVALHPREERFQALVARVLDRVQDQRGLKVWRGIDERFPTSREAFFRVLRWTIRIHGLEAGRTLHRNRFEEEPEDPFQLLIYGRGLIELKDFDGAEAAFGQLVEMEGTPEAVLVALGRLYMSLRQPMRAREIIAFAREKFGETRHITQTRERVEEDLRSLDEIVPAHAESNEHLPNLVIEHAFAMAIRERAAEVSFEPRRFVGTTVLINGSLGSGGAERQFTNTALGLDQATRLGLKIGDADIVGPVHIICRSLHSRAGADFFAPQFAGAGLPVHEYSQFPEFGGRPKFSRARDMIGLLDHLPAQMREGVARLTDYLRYVDPDVVHIWQDGSVLATGLAALLAGVPRILLGVRTLPPEDRFERNKPEYEAVYRALLSAQGVSIVANSHAAGERYEAWLKLSPGSVQVIPNGLDPLDATPDLQAEEMARDFDRSASTPRFIVGSVMRFDDNKRPLLWLDVAARIVSRTEEARFILVGDGPLLHRAMAHARELGIADRVLFTGRSARVGYWLSRMDAFLLLSRHEGLPNVLIEAQFAGVPVVTTPAGGAAETLQPGVTGTVLPAIDGLDPQAVAGEVLGWRRDADGRRALARTTSHWSRGCFSMQRMLELTVDAYLDGRRECGVP
ncbi:glycosyltransferase [Labrys miyagiensis]